MYGKIFASMFDGSLYGNWQAIVTFQQMIILCNSDGVIDMTPQALAARTSIPLDIIQAGIEALEAPDRYSRSPDLDGRRIERIDDRRPWGWRIVNYRKYREMVSAEEKREADRVRIAEKRRNEKRARQDATGRDMSQDVANRRAESQHVANVAQAEAEAEAVVEATSSGKGRVEARATRLALDSLPDEWANFCRQERGDLDPALTFARFSDYWRAKPGKDGRKVDWFATWRNWVRNERPGKAPKEHGAALGWARGGV